MQSHCCRAIENILESFLEIRIFKIRQHKNSSIAKFRNLILW